MSGPLTFNLYLGLSLSSIWKAESASEMVQRWSWTSLCATVQTESLGLYSRTQRHVVVKITLAEQCRPHDALLTTYALHGSCSPTTHYHNYLLKVPQ